MIGDRPPISRFTQSQVARIQKAIEAGREEMKRVEVHPLLFFKAFSRAGGVCVPGRGAMDAASLRPLCSLIEMELGGFNTASSGHWSRLSPDMADTVRREINRAHGEAYMAGARGRSWLKGFRLVGGDHVADQEAFRKFAECDNYGLGPAVFPPDAVVVLQPALDGAGFETVYVDDEHSPQTETIGIPPAAHPVVSESASSNGAGAAAIKTKWPDAWLVIASLVAAFLLGRCST